MTSQLLRFAAGSSEKDTENGAAVMSLRSFLFRDNFRLNLIVLVTLWQVNFISLPYLSLCSKY